MHMAETMAKKNNGRPDEYVPIVRIQETRKNILKKMMEEKKLTRFSKQASKYINTGSPDIDIVIKGMVELKWCFEYNNMNDRIREKLKSNNHVMTQELFEGVRTEILSENPVPDVLPWLNTPIKK